MAGRGELMPRGRVVITALTCKSPWSRHRSTRDDSPFGGGGQRGQRRASLGAIDRGRARPRQPQRDCWVPWRAV